MARINDAVSRQYILSIPFLVTARRVPVKSTIEKFTIQRLKIIRKEEIKRLKLLVALLSERINITGNITAINIPSFKRYLAMLALISTIIRTNPVQTIAADAFGQF